MATINGTPGNDNLIGTTDPDTINGGAGDDIISGGGGADTLTGGTGADTFLDTAAGLNGDTITDFLPGDRIQITDLPFSATDPSVANIQIVGNTITYGNGTTAGTIDIGNGISGGRFVIRPLGTSGMGVEIRFQQVAHNDFSGDGRSDVLWRLDDGTVREWLGQADGSFVGNIAHVNVNPGPGVTVVGTGDFNGDGREDILWRLDDGTVREWLGQADGSFVGNKAHVDVNPGTNWHVVGTGDFNGDGSSDILWRLDDGTVREWLGQPDGSFVDNATVNVNPGPGVTVVGTGDFNGDGRTDILWRLDDGTVREWLAQPDGSFVGNKAHVNINPGTSWHIVGIGDYNGDATDDILWRTDDGTVHEWLGQADGSFLTNANVNVNPGPGTHIQDPFVHDPFPFT